jgi:uncharacterized protein (DUF2252 family)
VTPVDHPSRTGRAAFGKAARARLSLDDQAVVDLSGRLDPLSLLERQAVTRVPELVPLRYGRMTATPFAFYRGAAMIMADDLARSPNSGLDAQLCGDAHLSNFGFFESPERQLVFDVNDFDETHRGPFEWDVKRLAASVAVAGRGNGFSGKERRRAVRAAGLGYREAMRQYARQGNLAVWYARLDMDEVVAEVRKDLDSARGALLAAAVEKASHRDSVDALAKLTTVVDGQPRILDRPPLLVPYEDLYPDEDLAAAFAHFRELTRSYRGTLEADRRHLLEQYELLQVARKVVGVGSVGTRAWILLFQGVDAQDPLFLQAKEAGPSVLEDYVHGQRFADQGERVVHGQHLMQAVSDIFLGWHRGPGHDGVERDFYIRQLRDGKGSVVVEGMRPDGMAVYAQFCGRTLARAHARSGDRVALAAYLGSSDRFERALAEFAETYATQNDQDHAALVAAIAAGRITAAYDP